MTMKRKTMCKKCQVPLRELEQDVETMTEEQYADYGAGFNCVFMCPKCSYQIVADKSTIYCKVDLEEDIPPPLLNYKNEKSINASVTKNKCLAKYNHYRGDYNEYLAKQHYENEGYNVIKLVHFDGLKHVLNSRELDPICMFYGLKDLWVHLRNLEKDSLAGVPDFLVVKEGDSIFIECKPSLDKIKPVQKKCHEKLIDLCYPVKIWCTKINFPEISHGSTKIYDVSKPP